MQIAQTTMCSIISKEAINYEITSAVAKASAAWGVKVQKYEVKNIIPKK